MPLAPEHERPDLHCANAGVAIEGANDSLAGEILGLDLKSYSASSERTEELCSILAETRSILREKKLFDAADRMRDRLARAGFKARDLPDGTSEII